VEVKQYSVYWINLDPTKGSEINKTRPCVIISPDEMNQNIKAVIVAPLTHTLKPYPTRVMCVVKGEKGAIMLDQIRTVDKSSIGAVISKLDVKESTQIKFIVNKMLC
jgi:mRNA interferase MazF